MNVATVETVKTSTAKTIATRVASAIIFASGIATLLYTTGAANKMQAWGEKHPAKVVLYRSLVLGGR